MSSYLAVFGAQDLIGEHPDMKDKKTSCINFNDLRDKNENHIILTFNPPLTIYGKPSGWIYGINSIIIN